MKPYYEDGALTIYHGDARDFDGSADLVATDPPYGEVSRKSQGLRSFDKADADSVTIPTDELLALLLASGAASYYVWCGTEQVSELRLPWSGSRCYTSMVGVSDESDRIPRPRRTMLTPSGVAALRTQRRVSP